MRFGARQIAGLCNGSTPDSDSVCEGSNPSPAARFCPGIMGFRGFLYVDERKTNERKTTLLVGFALGYNP